MHWGLQVSVVDESFFSLQTAGGEGLGRVPRETFLVNNDQVELVFEEVRTGGSPVTVVDGKVAALGPVGDVFARRRLGHVQND